jgi:hypothetical protein
MPAITVALVVDTQSDAKTSGPIALVVIGLTAAASIERANIMDCASP